MTASITMTIRELTIDEISAVAGGEKKGSTGSPKLDGAIKHAKDTIKPLTTTESLLAAWGHPGPFLPPL